MSDFGTFQMDRGWFEHPVFAPEPFTEREAWAWLIATAARGEKTRRVGTVLVPLIRGQLAYSIRFMGKRWQWHAAKVQRFLSRLVAESMIEVGSKAGATCITIINYARYQVTERVPVTESVTDTVVSQQQSPISNCKDNNISSTRNATESPTDTATIQIKKERILPSLDSELGDGGGNARARERPISDLAFGLAGDVMQILGIDREFIPPGWCGAPMWLQAGLNSGWRPEVIRVAAAKVRARKHYQPPFTFRYLMQPIIREHEIMAEPMLPMPPVVVASKQGQSHAQKTAAHQPDWRQSRDAFRGAFAELRAHNRAARAGGGGPGGEVIRFAAPGGRERS